MKNKYKMTGCAKFFIFLLFAAPIAFFASAYFNNEDGLAILKDKLNLDRTVTHTEATSPSNSDDESYDLKKTIEELRVRIEALESDLKEKDLELENLRQQLEAKE